ncbi:hypothetical protein EIN_047690 [Entamoeba invadens IP1]|uniref:Aquaporin n=1 Tax=Entamoeba invadens IP1 TaxID=370355 RepID=A0A0A1UDP7_ENTIV|nr:hypothetical protein EIN_047690 [Entamoeba invadens IP1]ELP94466.1 hypothetical protein EIN_047690 [Entamoeba invadens IP1]|eukprot:XP_004261237.1 hypothetical protein EIN_047690 [Entamoeba invadens IP1]
MDSLMAKINESPLKQRWTSICKNKLLRFAVGELFGSYILLMGTQASGFGKYGIVAGGLSCFFTLSVLIEILAPVSNAQLNPAITPLFYLFRGQTLYQSLVSIAAQFIGGFMGVLTLNGFYTDKLIVFSNVEHSFKLAISEFIGSTLLGFVLMIATHRKKHIPFLVAGIITAGVFIIPSCMIVNPMITVMRMFMNVTFSINPLMVLYVCIAEFLGFFVGAILAEFVVVEGEKDLYSNIDEETPNTENKMKPIGELPDEPIELPNIEKAAIINDDTKTQVSNQIS